LPLGHSEHMGMRQEKVNPGAADSSYAPAGDPGGRSRT
jgi:hypothetical protein